MIIKIKPLEWRRTSGADGFLPGRAGEALGLGPLVGVELPPAGLLAPPAALPLVLPPLGERGGRADVEAGLLRAVRGGVLAGAALLGAPLRSSSSVCTRRFSLLSSSLSAAIWTSRSPSAACEWTGGRG